MTITVNLSNVLGVLTLAAVGYLAYRQQRQHQTEKSTLSTIETLVANARTTNEKLDAATTIIGSVAISVGNMIGDVRSLQDTVAKLAEEKLTPEAAALVAEGTAKANALDAALVDLAASASAGAALQPEAPTETGETPPTDTPTDPAPPTDTPETPGETPVETGTPESPETDPNA